MKINIDTLTEKELIDLNHRIVARLKFIASMRAHTDMMEFSIGEKVCFSPPGHSKLVGILIKYNKKTVTVLTEDGEKWNVSPHFLSRPEGLKQSRKHSGNVIDITPQ